ncbi:hypothetical protein [uncultured Dialister sp.]|uniref:hypothetical protein n=1 Tax=uncultured Dialister sp. TaxID=278064 RepID=UPI0025D5D48D|nr:hypothetical protein [uncultured Dialister sp.]
MDKNDYKDITIKASEQDGGIRVNIVTDEKDSSVITTNIMLALCAMYEIPENYLPEIFDALGQVILKAQMEKQKEKSPFFRHLFR